MEIIARQTPLDMTVEAVICQSFRTSVRSLEHGTPERSDNIHHALSYIYKDICLVNSKFLCR